MELTPAVGSDIEKFEYLSTFRFQPLGYPLGVDDTVWPPWLMLPKGVQRRFYLESAASSTVPLTVTGAGGDVSPNAQTLSDSYEIVEFNSPTAGTAGELKVGAAANALETEPVGRFAVLERRNVKVTVHPIAYKSPTIGVVPVEPQNVPTAEDLEEYLDMVYGSQANVYFEVTVRPTVSVAYDVGVGNIGVGQPEKGKANGFFDICYPHTGQYESSEETLVTTASHDPEATVNVYIVATVGTVMGMTTQLLTPAYGEQGPHWWTTDNFVLGYAGKATKENGGVIWVWDYPMQPGSNLPLRPHHRWAIAHEIGHYLGIAYHSTIDLDWNPGHIPDSDNELRLMTGKEGSKRSTNPPRLVKPEWDLIQTWFNQNQNN